MASTEKRCLYEILGIQRDSTPDEIRSAYRKLALQRHPDKLVQSGVSEADATASFQELVNAYEVLSDPRERSWYDSHRSQILFAGSATSNSSSSIPDLFSFFSNSVFSGYSDTGKGFYKVYSDIFDKIFRNELNFAKKLGLELGAVKEAPVMGNLKSPYTQVTAFYGYWLGFATVMDFCWVDQYDAMAGVNRKSRRVMEDENKKLRKKARREYNDTVRGLAEFVKKRDKRVIDMQVKRNEEIEKKREEEKERKKQLEREKMERARAYEEPDWAKVEDEREMEEDHEVEDEKKQEGKELYCVVCSKKFKSDKQWKNHEQSKKHKEKVAELREAYGDEEMKNEGETEEEREGDNVGSVSAEDAIDELSEQFVDSVQLQKRTSVDEEAKSSEEDEFVDIDNGDSKLGMDEQFGFDDDDDEASILAAMVSGHKIKKNAKSAKPKANNSSAEASGANGDDDDEMDFMAYNNLKSTRKKRGTRKDRVRRNDEETATADNTEINEQDKEDNGAQEAETSSHALTENKHESGVQEAETSPHADVEKEQESNAKEDGVEKISKVTKQPVDKKGTSKKDANAKSKNASKGKKQKATSRSSGTVCEKCGEDFDTRNRLYRHLDESGHATLKSR